MNTKGKKVLVTGGTGFLGSKLASRLNKLGFSVSIIGRNENIGNKLKESGLEFIKADLAENDIIIESCRDKEYVFHCGALSSPWGKYSEFYKTNVLGTVNVIAGCKRYGVSRLIHVSSPSIYNNFNNRVNIYETDPLPIKFVNAYSQTKYLAEVEIDKAHQQGLPVITIRPSGIFGPGDTSLLPRLIRINNHKFIPIIEKTKVYTDITYVENVVDALLLCLKSSENTFGKKYNITNGEPISLFEFLEDVIVRLGYKFNAKKISFRTAYLLAVMMELFSKSLLSYKEPALTRYTVGILSRSRILNISAAAKDLKYYPKFSIAEGVNETIKQWKNTNEC